MSKRKTPTLRFKGFNNDWEQRKLGDIAKIVMGQSPSSKNYTKNPEDYILVQGNADVRNGKVVPRVWTTQITKIAHKGDIILTVRAPVGEVAITDYTIVLGRGVASIKSNKFIFQLLIKMNRNGFWNTLSTGSTFESINSNDIKKAIIFIPSIKEQNKIENLLNLTDKLLTLQKRKYEELKLLKKALMQNMFANTSFYPKLRFKGFIYKCEQYKLSDLGYTFSGLSGKSKKDFGHGKAQYITYMNVFSNPIANLKMTEHIEIDNKQNSVKYNDIFFTTSSETPEEVGMSSIWLGREANTYLNSFCFGFRPSTKIDSYYIAFMLRSPSFRQKIMILAQGISRFNISKNKVMNIKISLPKISEQREIGITIKKIDNIVKLQTEFINQSKKLKNFLLQNMFI